MDCKSILFYKQGYDSVEFRLATKQKSSKLMRLLLSLDHNIRKSHPIFPQQIDQHSVFRHYSA